METMPEKGFLEQAKVRIREIAEKEDLLNVDVTVLAKPLTPEEAIGNPGRREGSLKDVLDLELNTNQYRAIFVATMNALLGHMGMVDKTVHCKDEEPEECALEIADTLLKRYGRVNVGLIGLNPAIAERLVDAFGPDHVRITDLNRDNIGQYRFGVEIWDGDTRTEDLIDASDVIIFTGTTLINNTFGGIWDRIHSGGKKYVVYGVTAAGIEALLGVERICPRGRDSFGRPHGASDAAD